EATVVAPGSDGLLFFPHLGGRSSPSVPHVRGGWLGATWSHTRAHFYRALLESMAYDYAGGLASIRHHAPGGVSGDVTVIGGGARSPLWNQIKADVLGLRYHVLANADRATLGSAIMAGHGVGIFPDMAATAQTMRHVTGTTLPDPARHGRYQPMAATYRDAYGHLDGVFRQLAGVRANRAVAG
ncbi:MAG: FGGY-family carbohydrate kinase, partial [Caldilineaceae bacterium]